MAGCWTYFLFWCAEFPSVLPQLLLSEVFEPEYVFDIVDASNQNTACELCRFLWFDCPSIDSLSYARNVMLAEVFGWFLRCPRFWACDLNLHLELRQKEWLRLHALCWIYLFTAVSGCSYPHFVFLLFDSDRLSNSGSRTYLFPLAYSSALTLMNSASIIASALFSEWETWALR
mgnify:CR=1 FL=1